METSQLLAASLELTELTKTIGLENDPEQSQPYRQHGFWA
jgi:hypothetical protein